MDIYYKTYIEDFLDEFMSIEYGARDHLITDKHFRDTFQKHPSKKNKINRDTDNFSKPVSEKSEIQNIVIIGAGYGGITSALRLERSLKNNIHYQIHLIDKNPYHTIKTQLHEAAVRNEVVTIPIHKILRKKNIQFHLGEVKSIDTQNKLIQIDDKFLSFQFLVIAVGSKTNYYNIEGLKEYSFPLQSLDDADNIYSSISKNCALASSETDPSKRQDLLRFAIGGGGLTGVEFAGELAEHTLNCASNFNINKTELEIIIIEAADRLVPAMDIGISERIKSKLINKGVKILTGVKILKRTEDEIFLSDNTSIKTKNLIWTGGVRVSDLLKRGGLKTSSIGRLIVDRYLQSEEYKNIFAIGDSANAIDPVTQRPVPAAAQFALQQGRIAAKNITAEIYGRKKEEYTPKVLGEVVSLGKHLAIGWLALPLKRKITFLGFLGRLLRTAIREKHIILLRKESRNWITY